MGGVRVCEVTSWRWSPGHVTMPGTSGRFAQMPNHTDGDSGALGGEACAACDLAQSKIKVTRSKGQVLQLLPIVNLNDENPDKPSVNGRGKTRPVTGQREEAEWLRGVGQPRPPDSARKETSCSESVAASGKRECRCP